MHIQASWGGFELVDIAKELYKAALTDKVRSIHRCMHIPISYDECIGRVHILPLPFCPPIMVFSLKSRQRVRSLLCMYYWV